MSLTTAHQLPNSRPPLPSRRKSRRSLSPAALVARWNRWWLGERRPFADDRPLDLMQLEDRVLYNAAPVPDAPDGENVDAAAAQLEHVTQLLDLLSAAEQQLLNQPAEPFSAEIDIAAAPHPAEAFSITDATTFHQDDPNPLDTSSLEMVFIDQHADGIEQLLNDLANTDGQNGRHWEVHLLDSDRDGVAQITDALADHAGLTAIHIVSHGADGAIQLGSTWLSLNSWDDHAAEIAQWNSSLREHGDVLLYGCDVAATDSGVELINRLHAATMLDVAASTNATGHSQFLGDWQLEFAAGQVETTTAFQSDVQENWQHLLGAPVAGSVISVNTTTDREQTTEFANPRAVASDADGNFVIVWESDRQDGSGWGIYARRFLADGTPLGGEFRVNDTVAGDQLHPAVAMNSDGAFVITYQFQAVPGVTKENIYAVLYADDGSIVRPEFILNDNIVKEQVDSTVAMRDDGSFAVTWYSRGLSGDPGGIRARLFDNSGAAISGDISVDLPNSSFQATPSIATNVAGDFVVSWSAKDSVTGRWDIFARPFAADGTALSAPIHVDQFNGGDQTSPSIALDDNGSFIVAWQSQNQDGSGDGIFARRFDASGNAVGNEYQVNVDTSNNQQAPSVTLDAAGNAAVTWTTNDQEVYLREFNSQGQPLTSNDTLVSNLVGQQYGASATFGGSGDLIVAFSGQSPSDSDGVLVRIFDIPDLPIVDLNGIAPGTQSAANFFQYGGPVALADVGALISDGDSTQLQSLVVTITNPLDGNQEFLLADTSGTSLSASYVNGKLTIQGPGAASLAEFNTVLRTIQYSNTSLSPTAGDRVIEFLPIDTSLRSGLSAHATSTVIAVSNAAPSLVLGVVTPLGYVENAGPVAVLSGAAVNDANDAMLSSATIQISSGYQLGADILGFMDTPQIQGSWNPIQAILTLSGSDSLAAYQAALRSVTFENTSDNPTGGTRTLTMLLNDGGLSSSAVFRQLNVVPVNDAPVLTGLEASVLPYVENAPPVPISAAVSISDLDHADLASAKVKITGGYHADEDRLEFTDTATIFGAWDATNGVLTLTGTDTLAAYQTALRSITYENTSENPTVSPRTVSIWVFDGTDPSGSVSRTVTPVPTNDVPVIGNLAGDGLAYSSGSGQHDIDQGTPAVIHDPDSADFDGGSMTVTIVSGGSAGEDELGIRNEGTTSGQLSRTGTTVLYNFGAGPIAIGSWTYDPSGMRLTVNWNAAANQLAISKLISSIAYENLGGATPTLGTRTVEYQVSDGDGGTGPAVNAFVTVSSSAPPELSNLGGDFLHYTEGAGPKQLDQNNDASVSDPDSLDFDLGQLIVSISNGGEPGEDRLAVRHQGMTTGQIGVDGVNVYYGGVLVGTTTGGSGGADLIISLNVQADAAAASALLRGITYENTNLHNPSTALREVRFMLSDGDGVTSSTQDVVVAVHPVNDAPLLSNPSSTSVTYVEGNSPIIVGNSIHVADVDDTKLSSATVQITGNYQSGEDRLVFTGTGPISGHWDGAMGTLTITGQDTLADYQTALRSVRYVNLSDNPSTAARSVTFQAYDGSDYSNSIVLHVSVQAMNDAPLLASIEPFAESYSENGGLQIITNSLELTDPDSTNITSASVRIATNFMPGEDKLLFTDTPNIRGSWNAVTGTLVLNGSDSLAAYQTALRSVVYENRSEDPTSARRTIEFQVTDGIAASNSVTRQISVVPINDAAVLSAVETNSLLYAPGSGSLTVSHTIHVGDVDDTLIESAVIHITGGYVAGGEKLRFDNTASITGSWNGVTGTLTLTGADTLANYEQALRSVTYEFAGTTPVTQSRQVTFAVHDGDGPSNLATRQIQISVNVPPSTQADEYRVTSGTPLVVANPSSGVLANDVDPEGQSLYATLQVLPQKGTVTLRPDGTFIYTPNSGAVGFDVFVYRAHDAFQASAPTQVIVLIQAPAVASGTGTTPTNTSIEPPRNPSVPTEEPGDSSGADAGDSAANSPSNSASNQLTAPNGPGGPRPAQGPLSSAGAPAEAVFGGAASQSVLTERQSEETSDTSFDMPVFRTAELSLRNGSSDYRGAGYTRLDSALMNDSVQDILPMIDLTTFAPEGILWQELNELEQTVEKRMQMDGIRLASVVGAATSVSVGSVAWFLRGSYVLSCVMAQLPAWKMLDPLFVFNRTGIVNHDDDESLSAMLEKSNQDEQDNTELSSAPEIEEPASPETLALPPATPPSDKTD